MPKNAKRRTRSRPFIDFASSYGWEGQNDDYARLGQTESPEDVFRVWIRNFYSRERNKPESQQFWTLAEKGDPIALSTCNAFFNEVYYSTDFHKLPFQADEAAQHREVFFWRFFRLPSDSTTNLLQGPEVRKRIIHALKTTDAGFFVRLGKEIERGKQVIAKLKRLYFGSWAPRQPDSLALCDFTDEALAEYARIVLKNDRIELALARKTRQRLRLLKRTKAKVFRVTKDKCGRPQLFDKTGQELPGLG